MFSLDEIGADVWFLVYIFLAVNAVITLGIALSMIYCCVKNSERVEKDTSLSSRSAKLQAKLQPSKIVKPLDGKSIPPKSKTHPIQSIVNSCLSHPPPRPHQLPVSGRIVLCHPDTPITETHTKTLFLVIAPTHSMHNLMGISPDTPVFDPPLTAYGAAQAILAGRRLAAHRIDAVFSSPLSRAMHCAFLLSAARTACLNRSQAPDSVATRMYGDLFIDDAASDVLVDEWASVARTAGAEALTPGKPATPHRGPRTPLRGPPRARPDTAGRMLGAVATDLVTDVATAALGSCSLLPRPQAPRHATMRDLVVLAPSPRVPNTPGRAAIAPTRLHAFTARARTRIRVAGAHSRVDGEFRVRQGLSDSEHDDSSGDELDVISDSDMDMDVDADLALAEASPGSRPRARTPRTPRSRASAALAATQQHSALDSWFAPPPASSLRMLASSYFSSLHRSALSPLVAMSPYALQQIYATAQSHLIRRGVDPARPFPSSPRNTEPLQPLPPRAPAPVRVMAWPLASEAVLSPLHVGSSGSAMRDRWWSADWSAVAERWWWSPGDELGVDVAALHDAVWGSEEDEDVSLGLFDEDEEMELGSAPGDSKAQDVVRLMLDSDSDCDSSACPSPILSPARAQAGPLAPPPAAPVPLQRSESSKAPTPTQASVAVVPLNRATSGASPTMRSALPPPLPRMPTLPSLSLPGSPAFAAVLPPTRSSGTPSLSSLTAPPGSGSPSLSLTPLSIPALPPLPALPTPALSLRSPAGTPLFAARNPTASPLSAASPISPASPPVPTPTAALPKGRPAALSFAEPARCIRMSLDADPLVSDIEEEEDEAEDLDGLISLHELEADSDLADSDADEPRHFTFRVDEDDAALGIEDADRELYWAMAEGDAAAQSILDEEVASVSTIPAKPTVASAFSALAAMRAGQPSGLPPMPVLSVPRMPAVPPRMPTQPQQQQVKQISRDSPETATSDPSPSDDDASSPTAVLESVLAPLLASLPYPLSATDFLALNTDPTHHRELYALAATRKGPTPAREPAVSVIARVQALLADLVACPHTDVALVTHPIIARVLLSKAALPPGAAPAHVAGGQVVRLELVY